ncbi:MAG TPA: carboxypeptidase-like regulatory domain-containing protein, partial [Saprospiraceae bacterium]|nr:carboxypeptidase-like regulatory domain-containing protein [Saprospiraceae bacterium]
IVKINIQDGDNNCNKTGTALVSGKVMTENHQGLQQAEVRLTDLSRNITSMAMSDGTGQFTFTNISDGSYRLRPLYKKDHLMGINTIDLLHIQRHI